VTPEERNHLQYLCKRVVEERDPNEFDRLVLELIELLDQKVCFRQSRVAAVGQRSTRP
jgi:hypothetical protein